MPETAPEAPPAPDDRRVGDEYVDATSRGGVPGRRAATGTVPAAAGSRAAPPDTHREQHHPGLDGRASLSPCPLVGLVRATASEVALLRRLLHSPTAVWVAFVLVHGWLALVGLGPDPPGGVLGPRPVPLLDVARPARRASGPCSRAPGCTRRGRSSRCSPPRSAGPAAAPRTPTVWALMITVLDAVAVAFLLHIRRPGPPAGRHRPPRRLVVARVPAAARAGRDGSARRRHRSRGRRRPVDRAQPPAHHVRPPHGRRLGQGRARARCSSRCSWRCAGRGAAWWCPAAIVSVVVVGTVAALGGLPHVASFLTEQEERGLQIESPGATPVARRRAVLARPITRYLNEPIVTWEITGPGTQGAADVLGALFFLALGAAALLLWWRREQLGARHVVRRDRAHRAAGARRAAPDAGHARVQQGGLAAVHRLAGATGRGRAGPAAARLADHRVAGPGHRRRRRRWCSRGSTTRWSSAARR